MPAQTKTRSSSYYALKAREGNKALLYVYTQVCMYVLSVLHTETLLLKNISLACKLQGICYVQMKNVSEKFKIIFYFLETKFASANCQ